MRVPRPVLMKPFARKKAMAISHGISLEKAEKACANVKVLVSIVAPSPTIATAPRGNGAVTIPTMVATNTASRCHAWEVTPAGAGQLYSTTPTATDKPRFLRLAPFHSDLGAGGLADAACTTAGTELAPKAEGARPLALLSQRRCSLLGAIPWCCRFLLLLCAGEAALWGRARAPLCLGLWCALRVGAVPPRGTLMLCVDTMAAAEEIAE
mmetsp:Transcript_3473/g.8636  ORF Transcript_3473/g.8636 Transcript_3473/m.8636 type:complete len:210 (+) Transcript_3473:1311-1940(+)